MRELFLVAIGGGVGAAARYLLNAAVVAATGVVNLPVGTIAANLFGCVLVGALAAWFERAGIESPAASSQELRLLLVTGVLGGFTTFSAFGLETFALMRGGLIVAALANAALHLLGGLTLVWLGWSVMRGVQS